jgi:hypothetical protein
MPVLVRGKPAVIRVSHCTVLGVRRQVWPANNDLTGFRPPGEVPAAIRERLPPESAGKRSPHQLYAANGVIAFSSPGLRYEGNIGCLR